MAIKGLGIYPTFDMGWASHLKDIFDKSGVAAFAIAKLSLAAQPKIVEKTLEDSSTKNVTIQRLRYQFHNPQPIKGAAPLKELIAAGDEVRVVWIGHGGYCTLEDEDHTKLSRKFAPHYNTKGPQAFMSAKELARCIANVCKTSAGEVVYPSVLMITSCYAGQPRLTESGGIRLSKSEEPLAVRVLRKLRAICNPPEQQTCTVYASLRELQGAEIRLLSVPPTLNGDWIAKTL